ncbi:sushi, von Willebrand factor type A, EGF and pentraxin domain-containing protein 1-like isoform X2 [Acanthaster planci]|uniref:Sushi, von Willebrand factor type A, EGF and pentraxin domain-containing protein 1-like isoform X2 n=1 Tax=Acanthaster planci TaxID=133434 RepID=A0A8B7ZE82_ACAPL|nr:sushi, von Willebrand factor type A, EGF and pentraxin domain-containing protein 1-like isoform X2 [Acanthaster planci]
MVTVPDNEKPVFSWCPPSLSRDTSPGLGSTQVMWSDPIATDNSGVDPMIDCEPASGNQFSIGDKLVTCTAIDGAGNQEQCSFTVTIIDNEKPVFAWCPSSFSKEAPSGKDSLVITWSDPMATDNSGVNPTIDCQPASGNQFSIGDKLVTCTASDSAGNQEQCSFTVTIMGT